MPKRKSSAQQSKQITADDSLWLDSFCRETTSLSETWSDPLWKKEWIREIGHLINPPQSPVKPAVRKKKQTGNPAIERAVTLEPLSGEGFQSVVFPWPPYPPELDQRSVEKWTAVYNAVRSNGPCETINARFGAVLSFLKRVMLDAEDALQNVEQFGKDGSPKFRDFESRAFAGDCASKAFESFKCRLFPAVERGDIDAAVAIAIELGFLLCKSIVLQSDHVVAAAKKSQKGGEKGRAIISVNTSQCREATRQAVLDRWAESPGAKLSLTTIRKELAILGTKGNRPFGSLKKIEENTKGMKRPK